MKIENKRLPFIPLQSIPFLVLVIIALYTYAFFFRIPYAGFDFTASDGLIYLVHDGVNPAGLLQPGDELLQIGPVRLSDFRTNPRLTLFEGVEPGDTVSITLLRNGEQQTISWIFPGASTSQVLERLNGTWWIPFVLWLLGAATYLFIRPRNTQWRLLVAFNFLTAIWIAAGGGLVSWNILGAFFVFRAALWLCVPVYLHLHWVFPKPFNDMLVWPIYPAAFMLILLDWLQLLSETTYLVSFGLAVAGSLVLLVAHALFQPEQREPLRRLVRIAILIIAPLVITAVYGSLGGDLRFTALALLGLPFLPAAYIYAIYRHQLGTLEVRANRLIALYLYLVLLGSAALVGITVLANRFDFPGTAVAFSLLVTMLAGLVTVFGFNRFARFIERHILRIPVPPTSLLQTYAAEITTKLDEASLADVLTNQVLPSLLVRQSALVYLDFYQLSAAGVHEMAVLFEVEASGLPDLTDFPHLLQQAHRYRPPAGDDPATAGGEAPQPCPWVRLVLPLQAGNQTIGLWLLGRRDPDDFYSQTEIPILTALASQTAVALANILQARNLHALYRANIDQQEQERNRLALELHDDILNQIGLLGMYIDDDRVAPQFYEVYENLTARFRETIHGLRPVMLSYGLQAAFRELANNLNTRPAGSARVYCEIPPCDIRYPRQVEEHLFRIVQQAAENAQQHAQAQSIRIYGQLATDDIQLTVEDDGIGMPGDEPLDLAVFLRRNHFGLAGMFERAALVGALMQIVPADPHGTRVRITWPAGNR